MAINSDRSFDVGENGFGIRDDDDNLIGYITVSSGDPTGSSAPINTYVLDQTTQLLYYKFGAGDNDWRQRRAQDIAFDPTGITNLEPTDTNTYLAVQRLGNQSFSALTKADGTTSAGNQSTTSNGWVTKSGFAFTTSQIYVPGRIEISFTAEVGQSDEGKDVGSRFRWRQNGTASWNTLSDIRNGVGVDGAYELRTGFALIDIAFTDEIQLQAQWGQTDEGGTGFMRKVTMEVKQIDEV